MHSKRRVGRGALQQLKKYGYSMSEEGNSLIKRIAELEEQLGLAKQDNKSLVAENTWLRKDLDYCQKQADELEEIKEDLENKVKEMEDQIIEMMAGEDL